MSETQQRRSGTPARSGAPGGREEAWPVMIAVFLSAAAARVVYLATLSADELGGFGEIRDSLYYFARSGELARGDLLGDYAAFLSPLYCLFLAPLQALGIGTPAAARVLQALAAALVCALVALVAGRIGGRSSAALAGFGLAFYPPFVFYSVQLLPTVVVVLCNVAVLAAYDPGRRTSALRGLLVGVLCGLAVLAKSNALLLAPALALAHALFSWRDERSRCLPVAGLILAGSLVPILPVTIANAMITDRFVLVTTTTGKNLYKGNGPHATGTHVFLPTTREHALGGLRVHLAKDLPPRFVVDASSELTSLTLRYVLDHPDRTARLALRKLAYFAHARELGIRDDYAGARERSALLRIPFLNFGLLLGLGLGSLALLGPPRGRAWPVLLLLALQPVSLMIVFVLARYRMVAVACLWILVGAALPRALALARERSWRRPGLALAIALAVAGAAHLTPPKPVALGTEADAPIETIVPGPSPSRGERSIPGSSGEPSAPPPRDAGPARLRGRA